MYYAGIYVSHSEGMVDLARCHPSQSESVLSYTCVSSLRRQNLLSLGVRGRVGNVLD
jgi:hypothetical protein